MAYWRALARAIRKNLFRGIIHFELNHGLTLNEKHLLRNGEKSPYMSQLKNAPSHYLVGVIFTAQGPNSLAREHPLMAALEHAGYNFAPPSKP